MFNFIKKYIASLVLLITILLGSINIDVLGKPVSYYFNLQLILIYVFKISNPNLNFGKGIFLFLISIVNDSLNGLFFGTSAILYFIVFAVAAFQSSIKLRSIFIAEWISFGIALIIAYVIFFGLINLSGENVLIINIGLNFLITLICYPLIWFIISFLFVQNANR
ncbi:MAG: hypothetical protein ISQ17_01825 [Pelagibacteraceae bacterium]|nr:hypothetical protein [Pelagibacteraceae bacterium]